MKYIGHQYIDKNNPNGIECLELEKLIMAVVKKRQISR